MRGASTGTSAASTAQVSPPRPPPFHVWPEAWRCRGMSTCVNPVMQPSASNHIMVSHTRLTYSGGISNPMDHRVRCLQEGKQGQTGALSFGQVAEALKRVDAGAAPSDAAAAVSAAAQVTGCGAVKLPWPSQHACVRARRDGLEHV